MNYPKETTTSNEDPFTDPSKILPPYTIDQYRVKIFTNIDAIPQTPVHPINHKKRSKRNKYTDLPLPTIV